MTVFGVDEVHRMAKSKRREFILYEKSDDSGTDQIYLDTFAKGTLRKIKSQHKNQKVLKQLGVVVGLLSLPLWLITVIASPFIPGIFEVLGTFIGIVFVIIGVVDMWFRVERYKTLTESVWDFSQDEYLPHSFPIYYKQAKITPDALVKYFVSLSDKDFVETARKFIDWNKVEKAHEELTNKLEQSYENELDDEFIEAAYQKMKELDKKVVKVEKERNRFLLSVKKSASSSALTETLREADQALALND